ncbi:MAG: hypothetical protein WBE68_08620 [Candidatus Nitrosopolaris sp.]
MDWVYCIGLSYKSSGSAHVILIGASGAISGVLGIAAAAGNTRAYY